jgi:hypothetical protein
MLLLSTLLACSGRDDAVDAVDATDAAGDDDDAEIDDDGDGFTADEDCDDGDPDVNPDADEVLDGIDNDCDPFTCTGTGFSGTPTAWALPEGYGTGEARYPFEATTQLYASCASNYPEYATFDLTGDGIADLVVTLSPCADDATGGTQWLVYEGGPAGFAEEPVEWALPPGYGTGQARYPFEATTQLYASCASNYPEYATFDITGDRIPDLVVTLAPCADDATGGTRWLVHEGGPGGFAEDPVEWALPTGYGTGQARYPFEATTQLYASCASNYPEYATFDVTGDGVPDLVVTLSPCADDPTGGTRWLVHEGGSAGFAEDPVEWALPEAYGTRDARFPFEATTQLYASCASNYPEYATFDVTGDTMADLVVTLAPCADDETGGTRWLVYEGGQGGFAEQPVEWALPSGYGTGQARYPFEATTQLYASCASNYPEYATFDLTGDGVSDLVVTLAPCADDATGGRRWLLYEGGAGGFAEEPVEWALPPGYGTGQARYPFEATTQLYASCASNYPEYATFDLTGDGVSDLVVTLSPCADDATGGRQWDVYAGRCEE